MAYYKVTTPEGVTVIVESSGPNMATVPFVPWVWVLDRVVKNETTITRYYDRTNRERVYTVEHLKPWQTLGIVPDYTVARNQAKIKIAQKVDVPLVYHI